MRMIHHFFLFFCLSFSRKEQNNTEQVVAYLHPYKKNVDDNYMLYDKENQEFLGKNTLPQHGSFLEDEGQEVAARPRSMSDWTMNNKKRTQTSNKRRATAPPGKASLVDCPGYLQGDTCDKDPTHRVCLKMAEDFWKNTNQPQWEVGTGGHWCVCMWAFNTQLEKGENTCENVKCNATDVCYVLRQEYDGSVKLSDELKKCLNTHCKEQAELCKKPEEADEGAHQEAHESHEGVVP